ncbi:MAG: carbohydrate binding domain-containing protein [Candidatus Omnitrophota bacterium]|nr:carbohydrate binding domain-containing protein [Candidatus Omnitrophota bacterium]
MKKIFLSLVFIFCAFALCSAQQEVLLIDDFEGVLDGGPDGTVDFGADAGSTVNVSADTQIKYCANQSMKIDYFANAGGYMWVARGYNLDAANSSWLVRPDEIDWARYNSFSFYIYGTASKALIAFDIKDNGGQIWRFTFEDNAKGWQRIICPFDTFSVRNDWQPQGADNNGKLDFPIASYQFEVLPQGEGTLHFDCISLTKE